MRGNAGGRDWNGNGKRDSFDRFIDYKASGASSKASSSSKPHKKSDEKQNPSDGATTVKSLLTIGLCLAGFLLPISAEMGALGSAVCLLSAVGISTLLWRN